MTLDSFFEVASGLDSKLQFTQEQWRHIIDIAFQLDSQFTNTAKCFYCDLLGFDYEDCEDLLSDIEMGNDDALNRFANDVSYYFNN